MIVKMPVTIKHRLILMIMAITVFALLISGVAFLVVDQAAAKKSMAERLSILSKVIADRSTAAIIFRDQEAAIQIISALKQDSSVLIACTYTLSNQLFAFYGKTDEMYCPDKVERTGIWYEENYLFLTQNILLKDKSIGVFHITASLTEVSGRLKQYTFIVFVIIFSASIAAYYLSSKLQNVLTRPLIKLTDLTDFISNNADYSPRIPDDEKGEIGVLYHSFSKMIEQLHARELARDLAEKTLIDNEYNLSITLDSIGDAVIATDSVGNVTRMNAVAEKLTGWSLNEAKGDNLRKIFTIYNADTGEPIINPVDKVLATGEVMHLSNHATLTSRDGVAYQISDSAAPIRDNNKNILGMVLVFNDVTEQYHLRESASKSKRDLQAIMDHSPAVIYVKDLEGRYTFANLEFLKLMHLERNEVINKSDHELFSKQIADELQRNDKAVMAVKHSLEIEELVLLDNGMRTFSSIKFPLFDEDGSIYSICGISTDISERNKQLEQLNRSQKMDALGKLTGGVAHDYNNMLGVILGYSELLETSLTKEPSLKKYVSEIIHAGKRGANLTKKLLDFSRQKPSEEKILNINALLTNEKNLLDKTLTARINLIFELSDDLWKVKLDSGDFEDAIINISINAMHSITGGGQITIQTFNKIITITDSQILNIKPGEYILISISDTGSGMDAETLKKIFDPFFSTKGEMGTGLGLSQVYGFVERSGGTISVDSKLGIGTKFDLYFPRCLVDEQDVMARSSDAITNIHGTETILLVDDESALLELTNVILSNQGYKVLCAKNGEQALEVLASEYIDLLLSDIIMPEMDGYQLAAFTMKKYPSVKIQLVSGFADIYHEDMVDDVLKQKIIRKPYSAKTILTRIRDLLDE